MIISMIVAVDEKNGIGRDNALPWKIPEDLRRFKQITMGHVCIVGTNTLDSIIAYADRGGIPRPVLPGRIIVRVSRQHRPSSSRFISVNSPDTAIAVAQSIEAFGVRFAGGEKSGEILPQEVFVLGGAQIYAELLPWVDRIYATQVETDADCDTHLPDGWRGGFDHCVALAGLQPVDGVKYSFNTYERRDMV